jgi:hypothetical protein
MVLLYLLKCFEERRNEPVGMLLLAVVMLCVVVALGLSAIDFGLIGAVVAQAILVALLSIDIAHCSTVTSRKYSDSYVAMMLSRLIWFWVVTAGLYAALIAIVFQKNTATFLLAEVVFILWCWLLGGIAGTLRKMIDDAETPATKS